MRQLRIIKQTINKETPVLDRYLQEISKVGLITPEEEVVLARQIKKGNKVALDRLINANLRFVVSVSKQYQQRGLSLSDLINEGNLGLIKAAQRFDETRGFKFISYAVWWIRQSILQALSGQSRTVRLPLNKIRSMNEVNKVLISLEQEHQREPSVCEIASMLDVSQKDVIEVIKSSKCQVSMDAPIGLEKGGSRYDIFLSRDESLPDSELLRSSLAFEIERSLLALSSREASIICMYFGLEENESCSLDKIGQELHLTQERVRQIKANAIEKMKLTFRFDS